MKRLIFLLVLSGTLTACGTDTDAALAVVTSPEPQYEVLEVFECVTHESTWATTVRCSVTLEDYGEVSVAGPVEPGDLLTDKEIVR